MKLPVLYVDDEQINLLNTRISLQDHYDVYTAPDAAQALSILNETAIRMLLTDQRMPGMTGVQLATHLRETGNTIPIVIITGYIDDETVNGAVEGGIVQEVIVKPFSLKRLIATIETLIGRI